MLKLTVPVGSTAVAFDDDTSVNPAQNLHDPWVCPPLEAKPNSVDLSAISARHWEPRGAWSLEQLREAQSDHVVATWGNTNAIAGIPMLTASEGIYVIDMQGKRYIDWTSMAICSNIGYSVPPTVASAVSEQLEAGCSGADGRG